MLGLDRNTTRILIGCAVVLAVILGIAVCVIAGLFIWRRSDTSQAATPLVVTQVVIATQLQALPTRAATLAPADTPVPAPTMTAPPAPSSTPPPAPTAAPNASYQGVTFSFDPAVAAGIQPATIPANPPATDGPPWDVNPEYIQFKLNGYVLVDTFHQPTIMIYPAEEFANLSDQAAETIAELRDMLAGKPTQVTRIPLLPIWNAGQVMHARMAYLDFKNGSGVRFLTEYAQAVTSINNYSLFYSFQGLTTDGRYYVAAVLPVSHPGLPDSYEMSNDEYQKLEKDYQGYLDGVITMLEAQPAASFTPSIEKLDALFQSLQVK